MLIVTAHNDRTGSAGIGNYDVEIRVTVDAYGTRALLWKGRVEGHCRARGYAALLREIARAAEKNGGHREDT